MLYNVGLYRYWYDWTVIGHLIAVCCKVSYNRYDKSDYMDGWNFDNYFDKLSHVYCVKAEG